MKRRAAVIGIALAAATAPAAAPASPSGAIEARVSTFRSAKGSLVCRLFSRGDGFPAKGFQAERRVAVHGKSETCTFRDVALGTYAVAVFHDENDNGKLDTNILGLPIEGVGTSNNKRPLIGPPTWDGAKFEVSANVVLDVTLRY
jgi:uncharacterized protein (DUF2141 family)